MKLPTYSRLAIALLITLLVGLVIQAPAQIYSASALTLPNTVPTNGTALTFSPGTTNLITATKHDQIGLQVSFESIATHPSNTTWTFGFSLDGTTNVANVQPLVLTIPANGTTRVHFVTNITVGAVGYISLSSIVNAGPQPLTNVTVRYATKPKRTG